MCVAVFTGGISPMPETVRHIFEKIGFPRYRIAADSGLDAAESFAQHCKFAGTQNAAANGAADLIIGDMDSISSRERLAAYQREQVEIWQQDKDYSDTELALLRAHEYVQRHETHHAEAAESPIVLIGGDGGRLDHLWGILRLLGSALSPDIWLCATQAVYVLYGEPHKNNRRASSSLEIHGLTQNDALSIFPLAAAPANETMQHLLHAEGLSWNIDSLDWKSGMHSLSNKIASEYEKNVLPVKIAARSGAFSVCVPLHPHCEVTRE